MVNNKTSNKTITERYNYLWKSILNDGRDTMGDLELTLKFIEKINIIKKDAAILEIGCGIGTLTSWFFCQGYTNIIGIDLSNVAISYGKSRFEKVTLKIMDATILNFPADNFDICMSFDLIEHLSEIDKHLKEVSRVLKTDGVYLLQTPNIITNSIVESIWDRGLSWRWQHPSLQFSWSIKARLHRAGFKSVNFIKILPVSDYKLKQLSSFLQTIIKIVPFNKLPIWMQSNFWIIAQ